MSFVIECFSLLWSPSRDASLPNLVPRRQLANANSWVPITTYGTLPLGGLIFAFLAGGSDLVPVLSDNPEAVPLLLDGATFLFSAFMVSRINPAAERAHRERLDMSRVGRDIVDGLRFLRESSLASAMTLGIVVAFTSVGAVLAIGPLFADDTLGAGNTGWGSSSRRSASAWGSGWRCRTRPWTSSTASTSSSGRSSRRREPCSCSQPCRASSSHRS